jgi:hypothetical protein
MKVNANQLTGLKADFNTACTDDNFAYNTQLFGNRNKIINGNFNVNQRGYVASTELTAGNYGHDRWKAGASNCTYTFSTTENVTTINIISGSLQQVIEGSNLESGTYYLTWTGTAQGKIGGGSYSNSGVSATITGGSNLTIEFNTGTISLVQFEKGVITPFEYRSVQCELLLCQRYYEKAINVAAGVAQSIYSTNAAAYYFKVKMRAVPTISNASFPDTAGSAVQIIDSTSISFAFQNSNANFSVGVGQKISFDASAEL